MDILTTLQSSAVHREEKKMDSIVEKENKCCATRVEKTKSSPCQGLLLPLSLNNSRRENSKPSLLGLPIFFLSPSLHIVAPTSCGRASLHSQGVVALILEYKVNEKKNI